MNMRRDRESTSILQWFLSMCVDNNNCVLGMCTCCSGAQRTVLIMEEHCPDYKGHPDYRGRPDNKDKPDYKGHPDHRGRPDNRSCPDYKGHPDYRGRPDNKGKPGQVVLIIRSSRLS